MLYSILCQMRLRALRTLTTCPRTWSTQIKYNTPTRVITVICYILYPIVQWNRWFANSDVPFQSVTNDLLHGQFAMQTYVLHQVDVTSELLHSWQFVHAQSNNKTIRPHVLFLSTRPEARAY